MSRGVQVRIAANEHGNFRMPAGANGLPRALVMPAIHHHRIVVVTLQEQTEFRRVHAAEVPR